MKSIKATARMDRRILYAHIEEALDHVESALLIPKTRVATRLKPEESFHLEEARKHLQALQKGPK